MNEMLNNRLIVDTDELEQFIKQIKSSSDDVAKSIKAIQEIANTIPDAWEGEDSVEFVENINNYLEKLNQIPAFYTNITDEMELLNNEYNEKDIVLSTKIDGEGY